MSRGRIRTIKPEWRLDQRMLRSGHEARIFSVVLITLADDEGRGRWIESKMAAEAFAFDIDPMVSLRAAVAGLSPWYLHVYEIDGEGYFQILKFPRHQYIEKPKESTLPPCPALEYVPKTAKSAPYYRFPSISPPMSHASPLLVPSVSSASSPVSSLPILDPYPLPHPGEAEAEKPRIPGAYGIVSQRLKDEFHRLGIWRSDPRGFAGCINAVLDFVDSNPGRRSDEVVVSAVRGFKDNARAAEKGWPYSFFAKNILEYVDRGKGPVTREELEANGGTKTMVWGDLTGATKHDRAEGRRDDEDDDG